MRTGTRVSHAENDEIEPSGQSGRRRKFLTRLALAGASVAGFKTIASANAALQSPEVLNSGGALRSKTAVLVMHYQNDVLDLWPSERSRLVGNTKKLCDVARDSGTPVYFLQLRFEPGYPGIPARNLMESNLAKTGKFTNDVIAPELGVTAADHVVIGRRISAFYNTDLEQHLDRTGVDTLILAGVQSAGVVLSTIAYASDADYRIFTVKDCCYDPDTVLHEHLFKTAFKTRSEILSLQQALTRLRAEKPYPLGPAT